MNVNSNNMMQQAQMKKMDGTGGGQGNGMGKMMKETISMLPEDVQSDVKSLMQALDPAAKKDAMKEMSQIETSNMTVEDLTTAIMDIFQSSEEATKSSYPSSFSVYA